MMNDGIMLRQREIILIPFPFSDLSGNKKRPAIIVSNNYFNRKSEDVICCLITSNPAMCKDCINITQTDLETGTLIYDSKIKPYRLFTISKKLIYKKLGLLNLKKYFFVKKEFEKLFSLI